MIVAVGLGTTEGMAVRGTSVGTPLTTRVALRVASLVTVTVAVGETVCVGTGVALSKAAGIPHQFHQPDVGVGGGTVAVGVGTSVTLSDDVPMVTGRSAVPVLEAQAVGVGEGVSEGVGDVVGVAA